MTVMMVLPHPKIYSLCYRYPNASLYLLLPPASDTVRKANAQHHTSTAPPGSKCPDPPVYCSLHFISLLSAAALLKY